MTPSAYTSDSWTVLFDDFENTTRAESKTVNAVYAAGYRSGMGLRLSDTNAYASYGPSSWNGSGPGPDTDNNRFRSGTIEFYYKPDTTLTAVSRSYLVSSGRQNPNDPLLLGRFTLGLSAGTSLEWSIGTAAAWITLTDFTTQMNAGQWYHVAVTWDTIAGVSILVNGRVKQTDPTAAAVESGVFHLGGSEDPAKATPPGTFDRFRFSSRVRTETELPTALEITLDSPAGNVFGQTLYQPFQVFYSARASDSPTISVKLILATDTYAFTGSEIRTGLSASETVTLSGLPSGRYRLVAVAQTSAETAFVGTDFLDIRPDTSSMTVSIGQPDNPHVCVISRLGWAATWMRNLRDAMLESAIGRLLTAEYYAL